MRQFLTSRLTKDVSFAAFAVVLSCVSAGSVAQDEPQLDPDTEALAQESHDSDTNADERAMEDEQDQAPARDAKLEKIDEAEVTYQDEGSDASEGQVQEQTATPLSEEVEDLKKAALELNRDLLILEEELLFPANSQIVIFVSLDVGKYFALDSVKVLIDDKLVASHLYTKRQNSALALGGIQRLYLGNLKAGKHEVTAFFVGMGPDNREYKRGATIVIEKDDDPKLLELKVRDSTANMQPEFEFEEWQL